MHVNTAFKKERRREKPTTVCVRTHDLLEKSFVLYHNN